MKRKFNEKLHVQEIITTALTPRSVHPEPDSPKVIGLPLIGNAEKVKKSSLSKPVENGSISPRLLQRKRYTNLTNKGKTISPSPMVQQPISLKHNQRSSAHTSSQGTTSSRDGQKSTCSNPNSSTQAKQFSSNADNKGSLSDPSTKTELSTLQKGSLPVTKKVILGLTPDDHPKKNTSGSDAFCKAFPSVSPPRYLSRTTRKVVNIVYPPFNKHGLTPQYSSQRTAEELEMTKTLNITGEKTGYTTAPSTKQIVKTSIEELPKEFRLNNESADDESNSNKIVLPVIPLIQAKGADTS